jgi:methyl-accepting chemotaxis protein
VLIGLGSLLALLAAAVAVAVLMIVGLENDATDLANREVRYTEAIHEAALSAKGIANDQRGFLLSGNPEYLEEIALRTGEARAAFALAGGFAVGATQRDAVDAARAGFERWLRVLKADIAAYQRGLHERAVAASLGSTRELRKTYERSLADAYVLGVRSIEEATTSVSDSSERSVRILLVYLAVAFVVGIAVAIWVVRTILKPAYALTRNAMEVLTRGRVLVEEDASGSHYGVVVEVPIEVVNALAGSALEAREALLPDDDPADREPG